MKANWKISTAIPVPFIKPPLSVIGFPGILVITHKMMKINVPDIPT